MRHGSQFTTVPFPSFCEEDSYGLDGEGGLEDQGVMLERGGGGPQFPSTARLACTQALFSDMSLNFAF